MLFIIPVVSGLIGAFWAASKNKNPILWGIVCFIFPVIGLIVLAMQAPEEPLEAKIASALKAGSNPQWSGGGAILSKISLT